MVLVDVGQLFRCAGQQRPPPPCQWTPHANGPAMPMPPPPSRKKKHGPPGYPLSKEETSPPHPRACAAVSASHSDQLLRNLHSTHPFLHYMLIFCSLCCLPSQSQRSDCLLKRCLEALFGAQSRVALPRRACFQPLLSGCTILPIISCSSFARFKYLEVHTGRDAASVFVWHFQKSTAF